MYLVQIVVAVVAVVVVVVVVVVVECSVSYVKNYYQFEEWWYGER